MKKILYSKQADKYLSKIAKNDEQAIKNAIEKIPEGDILSYKGKKGYFRLRVKKYRIIFTFGKDREEILIAIIDSRGQAYKKGV